MILGKLDVKEEKDIVQVRYFVRLISEKLGFNNLDIIKITTAASELTRNIYEYASTGAIYLELETRDGKHGFKLIFKDNGPGIKNIDKILNGQFKSKAGMGVGLIGAKKLMDEFHVKTDDKGTEVVIIKWLGSSISLKADTLKEIKEASDKISEETAIKSLKSQNREIIEILDLLREKNDLLEITNIELEEKNVQLKNTMTQLEGTLEELELFVETIPDGILVLSGKGIIRLVNNTFKNLFKNIVNEQLVVNSDIKLIPINNILTKTIQEIVLEKKEKVFDISPKQDLWLQIFSRFVRTPNEIEPLAVIIDVHDISNFVEFEIIRKQFVSTVSHELRTPITSIDLAIKSLEKYKSRLSDEQKDEIIKMISETSTVLIEMVEDLLILSRIESQKIILNLELANLRKLMTNVLITLEPKRIAKNITITVEVSDEITLICDEKRIRQIFRILIDNSIKYSKDNSKVVIRAINNYKGSYNPKNIDCVLVEVIDFGIGIKKIDIPHIFQTFFRSMDVGKIEGSGLGLSIAKQLTLLHNGDIFVESEYEKGSKFIVLLSKELPIEENL